MVRDYHANRGRIPRTVVALGIVSLFTDAASEMIYPLVPVFVSLLGSGALLLGVIEGVAETTAAMLKLISGIVSDRFGKRKLLVVAGYAVSSAIRPLTGIVTAAWQIVFIRMADRIGKGIRTAPRDALIASSTDETIRGRAYGFHRAMDHAGAVIGPLLAIIVLGVLILLFRMRDTMTILRWTFILAFIPGLFAVAALLLFVRESPVPAAPAAWKSFSLRRFDGNLLRYIGIVALFALGNSTDAFLLFRVRDALHHSETHYAVIRSLPLAGDMIGKFGDAQAQQNLMDIMFVPLIWAFFHIIKVLFSTPLGSLSDRIGRKKVIIAGWSVYAAVYCAFAFLDRLPDVMQIGATFGLFAVYALYYAFTEGAEKAFVADLVPTGLSGSAFGLFNFSTGVVLLPASILFGLLYQSYGAAAAFGTGAAIACLAMLLLTVLVRERPGSLRAGPDERRHAND
ncbi:MFS transporter [bacterium]|nr:MFS transporter [bacterium]